MIRNRPAFSLFELVLVVLLLGVVYAVVLGGNIINNRALTVSKSSVPTLWLAAEDKKLIVYDKCSKVLRYRSDGNYTKEKLEVGLDDIEVYNPYTFELFTYADKTIDDQLYDVCLVLERNQNYIFKPVILHVNNIFYLIATFKEEMKTFSNLTEVKDFASTEEFMPQDRQRYYHE